MLFGRPPQKTLLDSCECRPVNVGTGRKTTDSRAKNQPKEEVLGTDPRTSGGHSRGYPGPKLRSGRSESWKNKHLGADTHDPKARTSTTLRDFQKLRSEKLRAEFSFPKKGLLRGFAEKSRKHLKKFHFCTFLDFFGCFLADPHKRPF